jgi:hypothetical protein
MPRLRSRLAVVELVLASALLILGVPAARSALHELGFVERLGGAGSGEPSGSHQIAPTAELDAEVPTTPTEELSLAFALLSRGNDPETAAAAGSTRVDRAATLFQDYLTQVPADGRAWAGLSSADIRRGNLDEASAALKMSILTAPWSSSLVLWRCGMAMDLFRTLDEENRDLMKGQFRVAAQRSARELVKIARSRNGVRLARLFLASSPDELIAFEAELAKSG